MDEIVQPGFRKLKEPETRELELAHHVDPGIDREGPCRRVAGPPCEIRETGRQPPTRRSAGSQAVAELPIGARGGLPHIGRTHRSLDKDAPVFRLVQRTRCDQFTRHLGRTSPPVPTANQTRGMVETSLEAVAVCTENPIRVDDVTELPKLAE
jgi:hypothetical protein